MENTINRLNHEYREKEYCFLCRQEVKATGHNRVHVGGIGETIACDRYLKGEDCRNDKISSLAQKLFRGGNLYRQSPEVVRRYENKAIEILGAEK